MTQRGAPILLLAHRVPYPPDKGDRIRTFHVLRELARHAPVHLAYLTEEPPAPDIDRALGQLCERVAAVPLGRWSRWLWAGLTVAGGGSITEGAFHAGALQQLVRRWARESGYRAAVVSASSMVPYLRLPELRQVPAIIDLVDVDSQKWLDYAAQGHGPRAWLYRLEGRRLRRLEAGLPAWARAVTLVSEAEARLYRGFAAPGRVLALTNGVNLDYFRPQPAAAASGCVFVGQLDYWPNVEGVCWFCREVWPAIRDRRPQETLALVGRNPVPAVRELAAVPGVELVGAVPDVRPHVARAAVVVVPLRIARGVQNKVLEALAMGRPVVASPQALAGVQATPGVHLLAAESPGQWCDTVTSLLADPARQQQLGAQGRRFVEEHHPWDRCLAALGELVGDPDVEAR